MKKYRVRIANDNEIPGYYSGGQYNNYQMFDDGGESDIDLSVLLDQATNMIAKAILQDPDPENVDTTPFMEKAGQFLLSSGLTDTQQVILLASTADKNAKKMLSYHMEKDEEIAKPINEVEDKEEVVDADNSVNYGYYDPSVASQNDPAEDDLVDSLINDEDDFAQDGLEVRNQQDKSKENFESFANMSGIDSNYNDYEVFMNQMAYGGSSGKRRFINEAMQRFAKAENGLEQKENISANLRGTSDDISGNKLSSKNIFVPAVKNEAQNFLNKEAANNEYNNMMSQQNPMQFGGTNRRLRRANRAMFGSDTILPGATADYDFNFFGGLKKAKVTFDPKMFGVTSIMPGMINSGSGSYYSPRYSITKSSSNVWGTMDKPTNPNISTIDKATNTVSNKVDADGFDETVDYDGNTYVDASDYAFFQQRMKKEQENKNIGTADEILNTATNGDGTSTGSTIVDELNPVREKQIKQDDIIEDQVVEDDVIEDEIIEDPLKPKKSTQIKNPNDKKIDFVYLPGTNNKINLGFTELNQYKPRNFKYYQTTDNKWHFIDDNGKKGLVTNPKSLDLLKKGQYMTKEQYAKTYDGKKRAYDKKTWDEKTWDFFAKPNFGMPDPGFVKPKTGLNPGNEDDPISRYVLPFIGFGPAIGPLSAPINGRKGWPGQGLLQSPPNYPVRSFNNGGSVTPDLYKYIYGGYDDMEDDYGFPNDDSNYEYGGLYEAEDGYTVNNGKPVSSPFDPSRMSPSFQRYNQDATAESNKAAFDEMKARGIVNGEYNSNQTYDMSNTNRKGYLGQPLNQPAINNISAGDGGGGVWNGYDPHLGPIDGIHQPRYGQYQPRIGNRFNFLQTDFSYLSPYAAGNTRRNGNLSIDPNTLMAASMQNIQKSGLIPYQHTFSKKRKTDGNWFERKLGFNKDRVHTIDFMRPDGTSVNGKEPQYGPDKDGYKFPNSNTPTKNVPAGPGRSGYDADSDGNGMPDYLQKPNPQDGSVGNALQPNTKEPLSNLEMLRKQGKVWDDKLNKWVDGNIPSKMPLLPAGLIDKKPNTSTLPIPTPQVNPTPKPVLPPNFLINNDGPRNPDNMRYGGYNDYDQMQYSMNLGGYLQSFDPGGTTNNTAVGLKKTELPLWITDPIKVASDPTLLNEKTFDPLDYNKDGIVNELDRDPDKDSLSFTEEKAKTFDPNKLRNLGMFVGSKAVNYLDQIDSKKKMDEETKKQMFDTGFAQQRTYTGKWDQNSGTQNKMGFENYSKKGGAISFRENKEYDLTMSQIQKMLKEGYKIEFI
jgi:hypothetical protein